MVYNGLSLIERRELLDPFLRRFEGCLVCDFFLGFVPIAALKNGFYVVV